MSARGLRARQVLAVKVQLLYGDVSIVATTEDSRTSCLITHICCNRQEETLPKSLIE